MECKKIHGIIDIQFTKYCFQDIDYGPVFRPAPREC